MCILYEGVPLINAFLLARAFVPLVFINCWSKNVEKDRILTRTIHGYTKANNITGWSLPSILPYHFISSYKTKNTVLDNPPPGSTFPPRLRARIKPHVHRATTLSKPNICTCIDKVKKKTPRWDFAGHLPKISYWNKESLSQLFPLSPPPAPLIENACTRNHPGPAGTSLFFLLYHPPP